MDTTRREFIGVVALAGVGLGASACGDNGGGTPNPDGGGDGGGGCNSVQSTIASNHNHTLTVPLADVTAAADKTYDIQGTSVHNHTVMVRAADFARLSTGGTANVTSSSTPGHSHAITIRCA